MMELQTVNTAYYIPTLGALRVFIKFCMGNVVNAEDMSVFYVKYKKHCFNFHRVCDKLVWSCDSLENYLEWGYTVITFRQRTE